MGIRHAPTIRYLPVDPTDLKVRALNIDGVTIRYFRR
jgi:hypothetical protein